MEFIIHRVNSIKKLKEIPRNYGIEIDLRTKGSKIILNHNPFKNGVEFTKFLSKYKHGTLILNIKESGIENRVLEILKKKKIYKYFFLDVEMPFICKNKKKINKNFAVRYSEYEDIETVKNFTNNVGWIWIDTFKKLPINKNNIKLLKKFKTCLVCPERWGRPKDIKKYYAKLKSLNYFPDSIMTSFKCLKKWEKLIFNF